jgi:hypothetical protein
MNKKRNTEELIRDDRPGEGKTPNREIWSPGQDIPNKEVATDEDNEDLENSEDDEDFDEADDEDDEGEGEDEESEEPNA